MNNMDKTTERGDVLIRTVGYLLLHHKADSYHAEDNTGRPVSPDSPIATKWDIIGAISLVSKHFNYNYWSLFESVHTVILGFSHNDYSQTALQSRWNNAPDFVRDRLAQKLTTVYW